MRVIIDLENNCEICQSRVAAMLGKDFADLPDGAFEAPAEVIFPCTHGAPEYAPTQMVAS